MNLIFGFIGWITTGLTWLFKTFLPDLAKKFGLGAITGLVQKAVSVVVITLTVSFFAFVVYFITTVYNAFRDFLSYTSSMSGSGDQYASCFLNLLHASGIAQGVQMSMPFLMMVLVFDFGYAAYRIVLFVTKTISDETFKTTESFK